MLEKKREAKKKKKNENENQEKHANETIIRHAIDISRKYRSHVILAKLNLFLSLRTQPNWTELDRIEQNWTELTVAVWTHLLATDGHDTGDAIDAAAAAANYIVHLSHIASQKS